MAINLSKPQVGSNISVTPLVDDVIYFDFPTSNVALSQVGDNFVLTFDDGSTITLLEFYNVYNAENMPTFNVEGVVIDGETFFTALEATELMPAAGPAPQQNADGAFFNADAVGDLNVSEADPLSGVDTQQDSRVLQLSALDGVDGTFSQFSEVSQPVIEPANPSAIAYSIEQPKVSVNVALILDSSGSLTVQNVQDIEQALNSLKAQLFDQNNPNALALDTDVVFNLGLFDYDFGVRVISINASELESFDFSTLWDEIASQGGLGATNWDAGFDIATAWFDSLGAKDETLTDVNINHSILLTDGIPTISFGNTVDIEKVAVTFEGERFSFVGEEVFSKPGYAEDSMIKFSTADGTKELVRVFDGGFTGQGDYVMMNQGGISYRYVAPADMPVLDVATGQVTFNGDVYTSKDGITYCTSSNLKQGKIIERIEDADGNVYWQHAGVDGGNVIITESSAVLPDFYDSIDITNGVLKHNAEEGFYYKEIIVGTGADEMVYQLRYPNAEKIEYGIEFPELYVQKAGVWTSVGQAEQIGNGGAYGVDSLNQAIESAQRLIESMGASSNFSIIRIGDEVVGAFNSFVETMGILDVTHLQDSTELSNAFLDIFNGIAQEAETLANALTKSIQAELGLTEDQLIDVTETMLGFAEAKDYAQLDNLSDATELAVSNLYQDPAYKYTNQTIDLTQNDSAFDPNNLEATTDSTILVDNVFIGARGNESVYAGAGNDVLFGGGGADKLYGGTGDDVLHGGTGADVLYGGQGADALMGGDGNDTMFFDGQDTLFGGLGLDIAVGSEADILAQLGNATGVELFVNDLGTAPLNSEMSADILFELNIGYDATNGTFTLESGEWQIDGAQDANGFTKYVHADYEIWINTAGTNVAMSTFSFTSNDPNSNFYADANITEIQADSFVVELKSVTPQSGINQGTADAIEASMSGLDYIDMTSSVFLANNGLSYDASQNTLELNDAWESNADQWHNSDTGLVLDSVENEVNVIIQGGA